MQHRFNALMEELRSRSVIRALIAYSVMAWMLLQVADVTFDRLPIPDDAMTVLIVLVITGSPIVGIFAWGYEITVKGIVRHEDIADGAPLVRLGEFRVVAMSTSTQLKDTVMDIVSIADRLEQCRDCSLA